MILIGDCRESMNQMEESSVDAIVCDPPYELGFMGKAWDSTGIANDPAMWAEALRVLKPGGQLVAFSGSRTYHRMTCAIEDAGFEIRDQIMWIYGSGFPKSHDVSKGIDKLAGAEREVVGKHTQGFRAADSGIEGWQRASHAEHGNITAPATDEARQWQGWGTALKPAHEPICLARKPFTGTVARNVLAHGTGAINVDGCRVGTDENLDRDQPLLRPDGIDRGHALGAGTGRSGAVKHVAARWPANICHDGSDEVLAGFPNSQGDSMNRKARTNKGSGNICYGERTSVEFNIARNDSGSAARFFYCAKASKSDRGIGNNHPTVKPQALMRWLCRLITPPGGTILDPFMGSGSTGIAAGAEGFGFIGCELSPEYAEIAERRMIDAADLFSKAA